MARKRMKQSVEELRQLLREQQIACTKTWEELEAREFAEKLPELTKQYAGKFFKYRNTYGGDSKGWWLYSHCVKVTGANESISTRFEITENGIHQFNLKFHEYGFHTYEIQIGRAEYERAVRRFIKLSHRLIPKEVIRHANK